MLCSKSKFSYKKGFPVSTISIYIDLSRPIDFQFMNYKIEVPGQILTSNRKYLLYYQGYFFKKYIFVVLLRCIQTKYFNKINVNHKLMRI